MNEDRALRLQPISDRDNTKLVFDSMCLALSSDNFEERVVVTPAGPTPLVVFWHKYMTINVWCGFRDPDVKQRRKYWNCFGIEGSPDEQTTLSPNLEINPPPNGGLDLRNGGVFLSCQSTGEKYVGHTGRITVNAQKRRLTREQFLERYESLDSHLPMIEVRRENQGDEIKIVLIGNISESDFKNKVFDFAKEVKNIKDRFRQESERET